MTGSDKSQPEALDHDEDQRGQRLAAEQRGLYEGVADEAAERLHLVLHHGRDFGRLHPLELVGWEAQDTVDQFEADAPQHPFAEAALVGVDVELEQAVDDDQEQKHQAEREQHLLPVELKAGKEFDRSEPLAGSKLMFMNGCVAPGVSKPLP